MRPPWLLWLVLGACQERGGSPGTAASSTPSAGTASASTSALAPGPGAGSALAAPSASPAVATSADGGGASAAPGACPEGMQAVDGGLFWMGERDSLPEEAPRHRVAVRSFCLDRTEVTVAAYQRCQDAGRCSPARKGPFCNGQSTDRAEHPINCVDWAQATAHCADRGARLPTEREWEYAARGGDEQRIYAWGPEPPDGRSCYAHAGTCPVGSFAPTRFGLHDLTGNVWEWTSSAFGPYPDDLTEGATRVYRGGSFSRRFPKWMRNGLRNRFRPEEWGAHLGLRCAADRPGAACPAGSAAEGGGCVVEGAPRPRPAASAAGASSGEVKPPPSEPVSLARDPGFDADCARHKPGRPLAFMVRGGTFTDRQRARGACVNRDVGVGFNSVCCAP